jgi:hypothetical protein
MAKREKETEQNDVVNWESVVYKEFGWLLLLFFLIFLMAEATCTHYAH